MWHLCETLAVLFKQRSRFIEKYNNDNFRDVPSDDSGQQDRGGGLPGDDAGAGADGWPPDSGDHHPLLHHSPRHRDPRQHLSLPRHLQELPPPHRHELLPRVPGLCWPHDHHPWWAFIRTSSLRVKGIHPKWPLFLHEALKTLSTRSVILPLRRRSGFCFLSTSRMVKFSRRSTN